MITSRVIDILFKSGAKSEIACDKPTEAQQILVEIATALPVQPVISIESSMTATVIASAQVAAISLGEAVRAIERQAPQQVERPRPRPAPLPQPVARPERGTLIAN
jgi:hypothetical protein